MHVLIELTKHINDTAEEPPKSGWIKANKLQNTRSLSKYCMEAIGCALLQIYIITKDCAVSKPASITT